MGGFSENLLKLTEFPFSYSLIGLLALIFGQGTNLEELSFAKIGPLLILMGFVATTLSICDPVGALQRVIIKSHRGRERPIIRSNPERVELDPSKRIYDFLNTMIFGQVIVSHFYIPYIFAIRYSPEDMKRFPEKDMFVFKRLEMQWYEQIRGHSLPFTSDRGFYRDVPVADLFAVIPDQRLEDISKLLEGVKQQTVKTRWIKAEIDKITALVYFIITISVFIVAIVILPYPQNLLHKFSQVFGDIESVRLGVQAFAILALLAVIVMLVLRIRGRDGLLYKASIVFRYLTALGAVKTDREKFKPNLQDVEGYLNSSDWPLAEYWVEQVQKEYTELFLSIVSKQGKGAVGVM